MSPGSSSHSWVGSNCTSCFSSTSRWHAFGASGSSLIAQCRWPRPCSRNTSYWSTCAPMPPQVGHVGIPFVHVLHQQGPVAVGGAREVGLAQRAGVDVPALALVVVHD